jgi:hypothetical protein
VLPARLSSDPEDARRAVLVGSSGRAPGLLSFELRVLRLEGVGDVLEENQAEDDVFVLGRVHVVAQCIGHLPELGLISEITGRLVVTIRLCHWKRCRFG